MTHVSSRQLLRRTTAAALLLAVLASACAHKPEFGPARPGYPSFKKAPYADERAARRDVDRIADLMEEGDLSEVIPQLQYLIEKYPETTAAKDACYYLGLAYYRIGTYRDALDAFQEYARAAPDGRYAEECNTYLTKAAAEYRRNVLTPEQIAEQIKTLRRDLNASPESPELAWKLADMLWKAGSYDEAGQLYVETAKKHPAYAQRDAYAQRIEWTTDTHYTVLSPTEMLRREIAKNPLAIINESHFRSGQDLFTRTSEYYVVSGQVVNRGESVLYGVQVIITLYGFGNVVYDTHTVSFGRLNPGETRAFSARFSTFDDIENVARHECVGTFQR